MQLVDLGNTATTSSFRIAGRTPFRPRIRSQHLSQRSQSCWLWVRRPGSGDTACHLLGFAFYKCRNSRTVTERATALREEVPSIEPGAKRVRVRLRSPSLRVQGLHEVIGNTKIRNGERWILCRFGLLHIVPQLQQHACVYVHTRSKEEKHTLSSLFPPKSLYSHV